MRSATWILIAACAACGSKRDEDPAPAGKPAEVKNGEATAAGAPGPAGEGPKTIEAPSEAECDIAVANMTTFMHDEVPGDADDKSHCLRMPRPVVICIQTARTVEAVDRCVDSYATAQGAPSDSRPSEADCRVAMTNVKRLVPDMEGDLAQLVKDCTLMSNAAEVKCIREAKSKDELDQCDSAGD